MWSYPPIYKTIPFIPNSPVTPSAFRLTYFWTFPRWSLVVLVVLWLWVNWCSKNPLRIYKECRPANCGTSFLFLDIWLTCAVCSTVVISVYHQNNKQHNGWHFWSILLTQWHPHVMCQLYLIINVTFYFIDVVLSFKKLSTLVLSVKLGCELSGFVDVRNQ